MEGPRRLLYLMPGSCIQVSSSGEFCIALPRRRASQSAIAAKVRYHPMVLFAASTRRRNQPLAQLRRSSDWFATRHCPEGNAASCTKVSVAGCGERRQWTFPAGIRRTWRATCCNRSNCGSEPIVKDAALETKVCAGAEPQQSMPGISDHDDYRKSC